MGLVVIDGLLIMACIVVSIWIRYDHKTIGQIYMEYVGGHFPAVLAFTVCFLGLLYANRMYRYAWLYVGTEAVRSLVYATSLATLLLGLTHRYMFGVEDQFPLTVVVIFWLLSNFAIGSHRIGVRLFLARMKRRMAHEARRNGNGHGDTSSKTRAVIVGDAEHAATIIKTLYHSHNLKHYEIVGILDNRPVVAGLFYSNVQVLGDTKQLVDLMDHKAIDEVIFAVNEESNGEKIREMVLKCRRRRIVAKVVPNFAESLARPNYLRLEDITVEDLLRRPTHQLDLNNFGKYLTGKRVMVTGAGGSIGSEICRLVMKAHPSELILLGHGENSIFKINQELRSKHPEFSSNLFPIIASVADECRIDRIFKRFKPHVVFHAAAHKHLPLMEYNVCEAVHNNVMGTNTIVQACADHGVERMVQISTDKAADPSSVMGATKWFCESIVRAMAREHKETTFLCVRFGNVLGSRGSVIPVFNEQIRNGGPVTVTHPEMTRYFMTIPEAVRLVVQSGSIGDTGDVYLLDMGTPVRILDLAEDMIRLHGYEPNIDIPITFTGIRPGEKMHEDLAALNECIERTAYDGINRVNCTKEFSCDEMSVVVNRLRDLAHKMDGGQVLGAFEEIIPGYANSARTTFTRLVS